MANNDEVQAIIQFFSLLKKLSNSKSAESAENITNELVRLRGRDHENCAIINRFTEDNVKLSKRTGAVDEEVKRLKGEVERLQVELSQRTKDAAEFNNLANARGQKLREETAKVTELKEYRLDLKVESNQDVGARWLRLWSVVKELAMDFFSEDLGPDILQSAAVNAWEPSTSRQYSKDFPSPATNTTEAKQMRIVAVEAIIASALARHIFRPIDAENEFSKAILAHENPDMEASYRSFHLAAIDKLPAYRNATVDRAVKATIAEVMGSVTYILTKEGAEEFRVNLEDACRTVEKEWRGFQQYKERYEVDMAGAEQWYEAVPLWEPSEPRGSPKPNGAGKKPAQDEARNGQKSERAVPARRKSKSSVVAIRVWPLLKVVNASGADTKFMGWALFSHQASEAEDQVRILEEQAMRASRQASREGGRQEDKGSGPNPLSLAFLQNSPKIS